MKKYILSLATIITSFSLTQAQDQKVGVVIPQETDTIYIYENDQIVFKRALTQVDSIKFQHNYIIDNDDDGSFSRVGNIDWHTQSLTVTQYADGSDIPTENLIQNASGNYYNFHAIAGGDLCPTGWRMPTHADFTALVQAVDGTVSIENLNNQLGVNFSSNGYILNLSGGILSSTNYTGFWTGVEFDQNNGRHWYFTDHSANSLTSKYNGLQVRCVKDVVVEIDDVIIRR